MQVAAAHEEGEVGLIVDEAADVAGEDEEGCRYGDMEGEVLRVVVEVQVREDLEGGFGG